MTQKNGSVREAEQRRLIAERFHPSVFIYEEMKERGYSLNDVTFRMRRFESEKEWAIERIALEMYLEVHDRDVILSDEQAEGLGRAFDVSPEFFKNLHAAWLREKAR